MEKPKQNPQEGKILEIIQMPGLPAEMKQKILLQSLEATHYKDLFSKKWLQSFLSKLYDPLITPFDRKRIVVNLIKKGFLSNDPQIRFFFNMHYQMKYGKQWLIKVIPDFARYYFIAKGKKLPLQNFLQLDEAETIADYRPQISVQDVVDAGLKQRVIQHDKVLNLEDLGLTSLEGLNNKNFNLKNIESINLNLNFLTHLPENMNLPNLKSLYLSKNKLTRFPETINLPNLRHLILDRNQLTHIPQYIFDKFPNLNWLILNTNQITHFPEGIEKLKGLKGLHLHDNPLKTVPEAVRSILILTLPKGV